MGNDVHRKATKADFGGTRFAPPRPHSTVVKKTELKQKLRKKEAPDQREIDVATPSTSRNPPYKST